MHKLSRWQVLFLSLCAVLALSTGIVGYVAITASQEVHTAACNLKNGYEEGIASNEDFLEHPEKYPQFNEPAVLKLTKTRIVAEESRLSDLDEVSC